ncbi:MAG: helix-turn-helix domain-containing protein [Clostridia bacterium]|nr:helix-turn-helix domain-containing protein [Clostridia bacterium]
MKHSDIFAEYIRSKDIIFKHAKGMRDIIGLEFHPYHEIFLFIGGDAEFISDSFRAPLSPRTVVIIPKESFHTFVVHGAEEDYHRYVFNFTDVPTLGKLIDEKMKSICLFPATDEMCALFEKLGENINEDAYKRELRLRAVFTEVLLEAETSAYEHAATTSSVHPVITEAIRFINTNISSIATVEDVALAVNLSPSYLSHIFARELHISPHRYILEQKLILANRKIEGGTGAVQAAAELGFGNYSGFYKMYKKMFGFPPSKAGKKETI